MNASRGLEVLETFADAAIQPSGKRPFEPDLKSLTKSEGFILKRLLRGDARECWVWQGSDRVQVAGTYKRVDGKRVPLTPARARPARQLVWEWAHRGQRAPRYLYLGCGNVWCHNPAHMTTERPKQIVTNRYEPSIATSTVVAPKLTDAEVRTLTRTAEMYTPAPPSTLLIDVLQLLQSAESKERRRVLAALQVYYADE